ncbi:MAG: hypothetical protein ACYCW6_03445 [Candidatus Xenobia bacterium]
MAGMIRASDKARSILKKYALLENKSQVEVLDEAMEALERQRFLDELRRGYVAIRNDEAARQELDGETELYDGAAADGLD